MKYYLGSFRVNQDQTIDLQIASTPLTVEQKQEYKEIMKCILDMNPVAHLYEIAHKNTEEMTSAFHEVHSSLSTTHMSRIWSSEHVHDTFSDITRYVMNFIWSSKAFIEHTESYLKSKFGVDSYEYKRCRYTITSLYDSQFSYRFFDVLRNYITHRDLPISNSNLKIKISPNASEPIMAAWSFRLQRDLILNNLAKHGGKGKFRRELAEQPELIDLEPILTEQAEWNRIIFRETMETQQYRFEDCLRYFKIIGKGMGVKPNDVMVIWFGDERPPNRHELIPVADLQRILRLMMVHGPTARLRSVTS